MGCFLNPSSISMIVGNLFSRKNQNPRNLRNLINSINSVNSLNVGLFILLLKLYLVKASPEVESDFT